MNTSRSLPSWLRPFWVKVPADAGLGEKKQRYITNGAALFVGLLGPLFLLLNLAQGQHGLALINGASSVVGIGSLALLRLNRARAAAILVVAGTGVLYTLSALLYHTGMEYPLLVSMLGAVFMFDSLLLRLPLALLNAGGFLAVKIMQFGPHMQAQFSVNRYVTNLVVFLLCYYVVQELLRAAYARYNRQIEQKNAELAESRRQLHHEHEQLMTRTAELDVSNRAKEKLFTLISHDLRGPFTGLKIMIGMLNNGHLSENDFKKLIPELSQHVGDACDCLDTLLAWSASQLGAIRPEPANVSIPDTVASCVALLAPAARQKQITFHNRVSPDAWVRADENQTLAILRNLIANALKFTPSGGQIEIDTAEEETHWRITVSDNGIGMSPEKVGDLFVSNVKRSTTGTAKERGLGLGLTICREFVASNGGTISAESTEGRGSRFHVRLPIST